MGIPSAPPLAAPADGISVLLDVSGCWKAAGLGRWLIAMLTCLLAATAVQAQDTGAETVPLESVDATTRSMWLIDGVVLDATSLQPLKDFSVTPGTLSTDQRQRTSLRWRDNLKREMKDGRLRWPRTSGFSVMRFRVTAEGYNPAVTQRIWRGGPHTRIQVRMKRIN